MTFKGHVAALRSASWSLLLGLGVWSPPVQAFCPTNGVRCGASGVGTTHQELTERALEALGTEFFGAHTPTQAMKRATEEVWKANAEVDDDQVNGFKHFDGESFLTGKQRLVTLLDGALRSLQAEDAQGGRRQLGEALHTLQDFYSHSNWIESGRSGAATALWRPEEPLPRLADENAPTCEPCAFVIISDGSLLVDCGGNVSTPALTSGFYGGENEVPGHPSKCRHGGPMDTGPGAFGGINKDTLSRTLSPHFDLHDAAASSALEASKQFVRDLRARLTERQLRLLFGVGPTLTVAVDTSAGMGPVLFQAARHLGALLESRRGTEQEPLRYVLVPFQGASTAAPRVLDDVREFRRALGTLTPSAREDCSAPALTAVLQALSASDGDGELFLLTQSRASDAALAPVLSALARTKRTRIHTVLAGSCAATGAAAEPVYSLLTADTGGQRFALGPSELDVFAHLVDATVRARPVTLVSGVKSDGGSALSVPVDGSLTQVTFSFSGVNSVRLTRPDGSLVTGRESGVRLTQSTTGVVLTVLRPAPGAWSATTRASSPYSFAVRGESPLAVDRFDFLALSGRPGHQGYAPLPGPPVLSSALAGARLSGDIASVRFELRALDGRLLLPLTLLPEPGGSPLEFFGPVGLTSEAFVVHALGRTSSGQSWQRVLPGAVSPRSVELTGPATRALVPGTAHEVSFQVRNTGGPNIFRPSARDSRGSGARITPELLVLGSGEVGVFTVRWDVPASLSAGASLTLATTVEGVAPEGVRNVASVVGVVTRGAR